MKPQNERCTESLRRRPTFRAPALHIPVALVALLCSLFVTSGCQTPAANESGLQAKVDGKDEAANCDQHRNAPASEVSDGIELRIIWVDPYVRHRPSDDYELWTMHIGVMLADRRAEPEESRSELNTAGAIVLNRLNNHPRKFVEIRSADAPDQQRVTIAHERFERAARGSMSDRGIGNAIFGPANREYRRIGEDRYCVVGMASVRIIEKPEAGVYEMRLKPEMWNASDRIIVPDEWFPFYFTGEHLPSESPIHRLPWRLSEEDEEDAENTDNATNG